MFKPGEIVTCCNLKVSDYYYRSRWGTGGVRSAIPIKYLTLDKRYKVLEVYDKLIVIINDTGQQKRYSIKRFKSVQRLPGYMLSSLERNKRFIYG